jgi:hypothetical protein
MIEKVKVGSYQTYWDEDLAIKLNEIIDAINELKEG